MGCLKCGCRFEDYKPHYIKVSGKTNMFPLCEKCWTEESIAGRKRYASKLFFIWFGDGHSLRELLKIEELVYKKIEEQIEKVLSGFHIIPLNIPILQESGAFKGILRAKGILLDMADCIIGLTAKLMNAEKIITRNTRHFQEFGITIESYDIT